MTLVILLQTKTSCYQRRAESCAIHLQQLLSANQLSVRNLGLGRPHLGAYQWDFNQ